MLKITAVFLAVLVVLASSGCKKPMPIAVAKGDSSTAPARPVIVDFGGGRFSPAADSPIFDPAFAVWEYESLEHPHVRMLEYRDLLAVDNVRPTSYHDFAELELVARKTQVQPPGSDKWINHGLHCTWYPGRSSMSFYEMGQQTYTGRDEMGVALPPRDHEWPSHQAW